MKTKIILLGFVMSVAVFSCTISRVASLSSSGKGDIELYTTKIPERSYVEIGYIQTEGTGLSTPQKLLDGLKNKAEELNADAIVNIRYDFRGESQVVSGTAIRYKD
jgi:hypothetical protein